MSTFARLCQYIHQQFTIQTHSIQPTHRLQRDLGLSETEMLEVVVHLELLYGLTLPDDQLTSSLSVKQLCALIDQHTGSEKPDSAFVVYRNPHYVFAGLVKSVNH